MSLPDALQAWTELLGPEHVITAPQELAAAATTTFATSWTIPAILRPATTEQVREVLRIAQRCRVPVYPISRGRNWGYGSKVPASDGCVLIELRRMDRIHGHDEQLGTLTVEPGVTFAQAYAYLKERGSRFFLTTIGGPPDASLIGNAVERGDGRGPNPDVFANVCALEVVLPNGERVETGLGRFKNARATHGYRWGLGPSLDGLFSQSNLGVVTRMTFFLSPKPGYYRELFGTIASAEQFPGMVDALRELWLEGTFRSSIFLWNDVKALSVQRQYPFAEVGGKVPLPNAVLAAWQEKFGRWGCTTGLYAPTPELGEAIAQRVRQVLEPKLSQLFLAEPEQEIPMLGAPSAKNLAMAYWRKRSPMPADADLDRDRCGFVWSSVAVPFESGAAADAVEIAARVPKMFTFEPNLALLAPTPRCLYLVTALIYDRDAEGDDARAAACLKALERELCASGFYPARLGIQSFPEQLPTTDDSRKLLERLKDLVDPNRILAPGRYGL